ncbi:hypothetical protein [Streptomyces sp. bgisy082]|uniref:hypothetical protein n=1 Tax=Streptomyces sp. bgisy082 TaxID=3413776 RepID=UPI003D70E33C
MEAAHPTPAGNLVPDAVVLLANGSSVFVEIDRTTSYAGLLDKLERYDVYRSAPAAGRGNAARAPRSHWQEAYAGSSLERPFPPVLFVFAPAPRGPGHQGGRFPRACPPPVERELPDDCGDHDPAPAGIERRRPAGVADRRSR